MEKLIFSLIIALITAFIIFAFCGTLAACILSGKISHEIEKQHLQEKLLGHKGGFAN